jgi:hypothetical protein
MATTVDIRELPDRFHEAAVQLVFTLVPESVDVEKPSMKTVGDADV